MAKVGVPHLGRDRTNDVLLFGGIFGITFWTYGKSGGATFRERQKPRLLRIERVGVEVGLEPSALVEGVDHRAQLSDALRFEHLIANTRMVPVGM